MDKIHIPKYVYQTPILQHKHHSDSDIFLSLASLNIDFIVHTMQCTLLLFESALAHYLIVWKENCPKAKHTYQPLLYAIKLPL